MKKAVRKTYLHSNAFQYHFKIILIHYPIIKNDNEFSIDVINLNEPKLQLYFIED